MIQLQHKHVFVFVLLTVSLICLCTGASLSAAEQKRYKAIIEGQGLYTPDDDVVIFTVHNFKTQLYNQKHGMLVEFYNSWCGFCQKFAPTWKALGNDVKMWNKVVKIGVFDCSDDENGPICREFEIMSYPTIRYIPENYLEAPGNYGIVVAKGTDVHSQRKELVIKLIGEQRNGHLKMAPNLLPYIHADLAPLFADQPATVSIVFLLFETPETVMGPELTLDLQKVPNIAVRYSNYNNTALTNNLGIAKVPAMVVQERNGPPHQLANGIHTREGFKMAIIKYLKDKNIPVSEPVSDKDTYTGRWDEVSVPNMDSLMEAREQEAIKQKVKAMGDVVFQMDLETALRYSLRDISNYKFIDGEKFAALKAYLNVLAKYFPLGRRGKQFLADLRDTVASKPGYIWGTEVQTLTKNAQNAQPAVYSSQNKWLGCKGSTKRYRGYPCGIWTLFHYLTVNAAELSAGTPNENTNEVLEAMLGYVKHFFGCAHCSQHFQEMAQQKELTSVHRLESGIMWLWMAHNDVNKRLAGDDTEDPDHRKYQFPSAERCPLCRTADAKWNFQEVLNYVKNVYSNRNVRYLGSDTGVLHEGLRVAPPHTTTDWGLARLDTSMCFLLYIACFSLLLVIIRIFLKRGYRKKMYVHDLLGKV